MRIVRHVFFALASQSRRREWKCQRSRAMAVGKRDGKQVKPLATGIIDMVSAFVTGKAASVVFGKRSQVSERSC